MMDSAEIERLIALGTKPSTLMQDAFGGKDEEEEEDEYRSFPAAPNTTVANQTVVEWRIYPQTFLDQLESLHRCDEVKRWRGQRAWEQTDAVLADGTVRAMTKTDLNQLLVAPAMHLLALVSLAGDMLPTHGQPEVVRQGDGIAKPLLIIVGGEHVTFKVQNFAELERMSAKGSLYDQIHTICDIGGLDPESLAPVEGWWLINNVGKPVQTAAKGPVSALHSLEASLRFTFAPETPMAVLVQRQDDYLKAIKRMNQPPPKKGKTR